jgi:hypothetical protein
VVKQERIAVENICVCEGDKVIREWRKLFVQQHLPSLSGSISGMVFKKNDMDGFCV